MTKRRFSRLAGLWILLALLHAAGAPVALAQSAQPVQSAPQQSLQQLATATDPGREQRLIEGAKKEGSLLFYTTTPVEYVNLLIEPFEKRYGIKVNVWRARSELILQRVINEARAGKVVADVVASIAPPMEALHRENLLQPVNSPRHAELVATAVPAHHAWASTLQYVFVQAYNTNRVAKADLPRTYQDLLAPRWKSAIAIEGSDHEWVSEVIKQLGEPQGMKFFNELASGNGLSVRSGHPLLTNLVGSGEIPLALTVYQYSAEQARKKGLPIDWFVIEPAITIADAMGVLRKAPHPHAALLFYDYMLGEEAQRILAKIGYYATSTKVEASLKNIRLKVLDPGTLLDEQDKSSARFDAIIRLNH